MTPTHDARSNVRQCMLGQSWSWLDSVSFVFIPAVYWSNRTVSLLWRVYQVHSKKRYREYLACPPAQKCTRLTTLQASEQSPIPESNSGHNAGGTVNRPYFHPRQETPSRSNRLQRLDSVMREATACNSSTSGCRTTIHRCQEPGRRRSKSLCAKRRCNLAELKHTSLEVGTTTPL